jgi:hypothetical protein
VHISFQNATTADARADTGCVLDAPREGSLRKKLLRPRRDDPARMAGGGRAGGGRRADRTSAPGMVWSGSPPAPGSGFFPTLGRCSISGLTRGSRPGRRTWPAACPRMADGALPGPRSTREPPASPCPRCRRQPRAARRRRRDGRRDPPIRSKVDGKIDLHGQVAVTDSRSNVRANRRTGRPAPGRPPDASSAAAGDPGTRHLVPAAAK